MKQITRFKVPHVKIEWFEVGWMWWQYLKNRVYGHILIWTFFLLWCGELTS